MNVPGLQPQSPSEGIPSRPARRSLTTYLLRCCVRWFLEPAYLLLCIVKLEFQCAVLRFQFRAANKRFIALSQENRDLLRQLRETLAQDPRGSVFGDQPLQQVEDAHGTADGISRRSKVNPEAPL